MNAPPFLQIVEKLEGFVGKLPASIQKPVLHELTPLKELFLKQRPPRIVLTGSHKTPVQEVVAALFAAAQPGDLRDVLMEVFRWQRTSVGGHGYISLLDARGAETAVLPKIEDELRRESADVFLHVIDGNSARPVLVRELETLERVASLRSADEKAAPIVGVSLVLPKTAATAEQNTTGNARSKLETALIERADLRPRVTEVLEIEVPLTGDTARPGAARLMSLLAQILPNEARVEMVRISRDRQAQAQIAQMLVKSTSAISTAVGAQPIPLADLPILTALQLGMVSGIMYISGRDRSMRAATEFVGALGVNVGAGMVLREGARAMLKFFPGWGNVVCGMVAGAGTYALGKAATVYFLEGVTLKDARRTYAALRKKQPRARLTTRSQAGSEPRHEA
ncbi:MAG: YcjF family protein [Chthoniobacterales bacterium]